MKLFKTEHIVAFTAIFISIATLFVYIYQAHIMQKQQMTSVWPYLQWGYTDDSTEGVYMELENKGIGPAIVTKVTMKLNGKPIRGFQKVFEALGDSTAASYVYAGVNGRVLSPGEKIQPFLIPDWKKGMEYLEKMEQQSFEYSICYCSVYGDCWTTYGLKVVEDDCK